MPEQCVCIAEGVTATDYLKDEGDYGYSSCGAGDACIFVKKAHRRKHEPGRHDFAKRARADDDNGLRSDFDLDDDSEIENHKEVR